jgi:hypothetical protein
MIRRTPRRKTRASGLGGADRPMLDIGLDGTATATGIVSAISVVDN